MMRQPTTRCRQWLALAGLAAALAVVAMGFPAAAAGQQGQPQQSQPPGKPLELADLMKLRTIQKPVISDDGRWAAWAEVPDRGDGRLVVRRTAGGAAGATEQSEYSVERGTGPQISADSRWVAAFVQPTLAEREKAGGKGSEEGEKKGPKTGLALLSTADGSVISRDRVEAFAFSKDGRWIAWKHFTDEKKDAEESEGKSAEKSEGTPGGGGEEAEETAAAEAGGKGKDERLGTTLVLRRLEGGMEGGLEIEIPHVESWAFDGTGGYLAYTVAAPGGEGNGVFLRALGEEGVPERRLAAATHGRYTSLAWPKDGPAVLAFVAAVDDEDGEPGDGAVWIWDAASGEAREAVAAAAAPPGWFVPSTNELAWSRDGERLFFGFKPVDEKVEKKMEQEGGQGTEESAFDPYDLEAILEKREVDVWHGDDPLIIPHQKERWKEEKDRVYRAVHHRRSGRTVPLADREMRLVEPVDNPAAALGLADVPYLKEITWDGRYQDAYRVDLGDGSRQKIAERLDEPPSLSPGGRYAVYWRFPHWVLFDGESGETRTLTEGLPVPFANEDHDYPQEAPGYGVAGWVEGDAAVLLYDKYDLWQFPTAGGEPLRLTGGEGRRQATIYRRVDLDPERDFLRSGERLLLTSYRDHEKDWGFAEARVGEAGVRPLLAEAKKFTFLAKAKKAERLLYTRESYTEFPDLWVADPALGGRHKISEANPEIADYAWGTAELVSWTSADGVPLEGVLIKPGNYREGQRYPVLVYFYRFFSQRLHEFNEPVVNHRPSFPVYASHGYAVFLPDIRFEVGRPGLSAVKALVPGVQKLIDLGVADPDAIGLHGHSWSGYQTAFVVTQTDLFKAAVAGAPVSNMTSAYGGIRYGSGMARQFQYEQSQSRLGASLWEARHLYIDNSPLFFADRIHTPLLIEFGDQDEAVPWTQGIELYLALRRLGKEVIFLEYRGEPHHPKKYANKLDYSIKMRQFFDHYLKGDPAPPWMSEGVPYRGE